MKRERGVPSAACGTPIPPGLSVPRCAFRLRHSAFTLLEMLVAAAITVLMVGLLHVIFQAVSGAVALGMATSDIIRANSDYTLQLTADAEAMLGPLDNGFLVLFHKRLSGVRLRPQDAANSTQRCDQAIWIRNVTSGVSPATSASANAFANADTTATHARVWYGHALRTDETGAGATQLGLAGPNEIAIHWVMGRQLLFLDDSPSSAVHITHPGWTVAGYSSPAPHGFWYTGLSDILDADLPQILEEINGTPLQPGIGFPRGAYQFGYADQRLWCNPRVPDNGTLDTWRLAQMHPYFIGNVSDLQIDFAGAYDGIPGLDVSIGGGVRWYSHFHNNPEQGRWQGNYDPNEPVTYSATADLSVFLEVDEPISASAQVEINSHPAPTAIYHTNPGLAHADAAITFRPLGVDWPRMLRFRYRVHDPKGLLTDRDGLPGKIFERIVRVPR